MKNLYLTGGAWGMIYQLGAITQLRGTIEREHPTLYGCSAGALSLVMMMLYDDVHTLELYKKFMRDVHDSISVNPFVHDNYNFTISHFKILDVINKEHPMAYVKLSNKLNIGITTERGFEWRSTFSSNMDLFNILLCSFHVPMLCSYDARIGDVKCIDGGYGINVERDLPDDCFVICPREYQPGKTNHKYLNGSIPTLFCITPPIDFVVLYYYTKGAQDIITYNKTGTTSTTMMIQLDEGDFATAMWWILRRLQTPDTKYIISRFE
jgi:hypothetical protein